MVVRNLGQTSPSPGSPTARLLLEYEQHLRNTLAKGMDAESYSLHTFEAIISQSNENLCKNKTLLCQDTRMAFRRLLSL